MRAGATPEHRAPIEHPKGNFDEKSGCLQAFPKKQQIFLRFRYFIIKRGKLESAGETATYLAGVFAKQRRSSSLR